MEEGGGDNTEDDRTDFMVLSCVTSSGMWNSTQATEAEPAGLLTTWLSSVSFEEAFGIL